MKFSLKIRRIEESDLNSKILFMPDDDDYAMYLNSLEEDIAGIDSVSQVTKNGSTLTIETNHPIDVQELKRLIKPFLSDTIMQNLHIESFTEL